MKLRFLLLFSTFLCLAANPGAHAQSSPAPVIVQPGAPGKPNKSLTPETARANSAPIKPSAADVKFMQGMIMHHGQAVEMTRLLAVQGSDPAVLEMGHRISVSQTDEMAFMKRWLTERGYPLVDPADDMGGMDMPSGMDMGDMPMMPGMLTKKQMAELKAAHGPAFDHLFLTGMIQHHTGALTMVRDLFANPGAGQDPILFDFATDVDNTQTAEINIMKALLKKEKQ